MALETMTHLGKSKSCSARYWNPKRSASLASLSLFPTSPTLKWYVPRPYTQYFRILPQNVLSVGTVGLSGVGVLSLVTLARDLTPLAREGSCPEDNGVTGCEGGAGSVGSPSLGSVRSADDSVRSSSKAPSPGPSHPRGETEAAWRGVRGSGLDAGRCLSGPGSGAALPDSSFSCTIIITRLSRLRRMIAVSTSSSSEGT
mmetsp:Transcript_135129/g.234301  ORF Transcript_135129/g.234301 Transcript_135129/m.234301 type:complete len:200 (-) Transcript_135129:556-1155(-)